MELSNIMHNLKNMCCLCLSVTNFPFNDFNAKDNDERTHFEKISSFHSQLVDIIEKKFAYVVCERCCNFIDMVCKFNKDCIKNLKLIMFYKKMFERKSCVQPRKPNDEFKKIETIYLDAHTSNYDNVDEKNPEEIKIKEEKIEFSFSGEGSVRNVEMDEIIHNNADSKGDTPKQEYNENIDDKTIKTELCTSVTEFVNCSMIHSDINIKSETEDDNKNDEEIIKVETQKTEPNINIIHSEMNIKMETEDDNDEPNVNIRTEIEVERTFGSSNSTDQSERSELVENVSTSTNVQQTEFISSECEKTIEKNQKNEEMHECNECDAVFTKKYHLHIHKRTHNGGTTYDCDVCGKPFISKTHLKYHVAIHTGLKEFECDVCKKLFRRKSDLNDHKLSHSNEKPFSCDICHKTFRRSSYVKQHKRFHKGDTLKCHVCQEFFTSKHELSRHSLIHQNKEPAKCDICDKEFSHPNALRTHKITLHAEGHECEVCHKTFIKKSSLDRHKLIHSGETLSNHCEKCNKTFVTHANLIQHKIRNPDCITKSIKKSKTDEILREIKSLFPS